MLEERRDRPSPPPTWRRCARLVLFERAEELVRPVARDRFRVRNPFIAGQLGPRARTSSGARSSCATSSRARAIPSGWRGRGAWARRASSSSSSTACSRARRRRSCRSTGTCRAARTRAGWPTGCSGSVEDSESFRRATDIDVEDLEGLAVADMLTTLVRRTVRSGWRLLLLVDEAEELLAVGRADTVVLARLRRIFQKGPDVRTVLTATKRLARIDEISDVATSPFLQGFIPPVYLTPLAADEARALLARGQFSKDEVDDRPGAHGLPSVPRAAHRQPPLREPRPRGHPRPGGGGRDGGQLLLRGLPDPRRRRARAARAGGPRRRAHAPRSWPRPSGATRRRSSRSSTGCA